jgi:hypothetical protein
LTHAIFKNSPRAAIGKGNRDPLERLKNNRMKREPGPGSYDPNKTFSTESLGRTTGFSIPKDVRNKKVILSPGPIYESAQARLSLLKSGPAFKIGSSTRTDASRHNKWLPGPGTYSIQRQSERIWMSAMRQSFTKTIREIAEPVHLMQTQTGPGPGSYRLPALFGACEEYQIPRSKRITRV